MHASRRWANTFVDAISQKIWDNNRNLTATEKLKMGIEYANQACKNLKNKVNTKYIDALKTEIKHTQECYKVIKIKEKTNER